MALPKFLGQFILATNDPDLPAEEVLSNYKTQAHSVERGFRFLKDPLFFADSLFLKTPSRIMALIMVMGLALLMDSLAEHWIRQSLKEKKETIPNQLMKPTATPTWADVSLLRDFCVFLSMVATSPKHFGVNSSVFIPKSFSRGADFKDWHPLRWMRTPHFS